MRDEDLHKLQDSLTVEEKIGQLIQLSGEFYNASDISLGPQRKLGITQRTVDLSGSVLNVAGAEAIRKLQTEHLKKSAHAIPLLFMSDIVYGYKTIYPIPLGLGATWNPELIEKAYQNTAEEAYAGGTHVTFAPMIDLVRDARWGRVLESTGEDPYLNSVYAKAMVEGLQHDLAEGKGLVSCIKHFAAYGAAESGREYNSVDMSISNLYQNYLPSYKAAVEAGTKMVMTSLTTLNGVPSTADKWLMQDVLRRDWGFDGVLITDYASIYELIQHGFAADIKDAAAKALDAGVDIDMKSPCYANGLQELLDDGHLDMQKLEMAVWRVLSLKNELGLFEDPFRGSSAELERATILTADKREYARKVSRESLVLLKNDSDILPLADKAEQTIALVGPYAEEKELLGLWAVHGDRNDTITIADGILENVGSKNLLVQKGTDIIRDRSFFEVAGMIPGLADKFISEDNVEIQNQKKAIEVAKKADIIIFAGGEHTLQSGEAGSRTHLRLPDNQMELFTELKKLNKPIITIIISGRPLVLTDIVEDSKAVIQAWFPGSEGGHAIADVLFGKYNPSGRLSMSFPATEGQLPIYYNHLATGRPEQTSQHVGRFVSKYTDAQTGPLYPFGFGLSYGSVEYGKIRLQKSIFHQNENITVSLDIKNTSNIVRSETVQFYLRDLVAEIVQPVKKLVGFKKVSLKPGEIKKIECIIKAKQLGYYNNLGELVVEPGEFELYVGRNSQELESVKIELSD